MSKIDVSDEIADFDGETFQRLVTELDADRETRRELLTEFLQSSERLVRELREGLDASDRRKIGRAAHSLKSSSAMFGLERLASLSQHMEEAEGDARLLANAVASAEETFARAKAAVEGLLSQLVAPADTAVARPAAQLNRRTPES